MTSRATRSTTDAVLTLLETTGLVVGDGAAPDDGEGWQGSPGQSEFVAYVVLHRVLVVRQSDEASIADPDDAPMLGYQVTAVGADQHQAEAASDLAATVLLGGSLDITDRAVITVRHDGSAGSFADPDTHPPLWASVERYIVETDDTTGS